MYHYCFIYTKKDCEGIAREEAPCEIVCCIYVFSYYGEDATLDIEKRNDTKADIPLDCLS